MMREWSDRRHWRSLEELADTEEFREYLHREFPENASEWSDPVTRRQFIRVMGASLALAGIGTASTRQPREEIVPYGRAPEQIVPGVPLYFATAAVLSGYGIGILAESHMGRPTKIEGNPDHPASLGAADALTQATVLDLYDPDRSKAPTHLGEIRPWGDFTGAMKDVVERAKESGGAGIRILTGRVTSPTLAAQIGAFLAAHPKARWVVHEPAASGHALEGARLVYGVPYDTHYRFEGAARIVSLDADFLGTGPARLRYIRDYTRGRRPDVPGGMNRLYVMESTPSITGGMADHRLAVRSSEVAGLARALAAALGVEGVGAGAGSGAHAEWIRAVARDLEAHRGASVVIAGEGQPPEVHALAHAMNRALGNTGRTVIHTEPVEALPPGGLTLAGLAEEMGRGEVTLLLILGSNPVYTAPVDLEFTAKLEKVALRIHHGLHADETSRWCHWHLPAAHDLEAWSDVRAFDGTASIVQPLIEPLYGGKSAHEVLSVFMGQPTRAGYDVVREHWRGKLEGDFDRAWSRALHDGVIPGTALPSLTPEPVAGWQAPLRTDLTGAAGRVAVTPAVLDSASQRRGGGIEMASLTPSSRDGAVVPAATTAIAQTGAPGGLEIFFREDPSVFDGRFANNGWLQELPRPITRITWENAALISPATAARLGVATGDEIEISVGTRKVTAPVWVTPGHAADCVTVHLGYGRTHAGRVGDGAGFNAYALRFSAVPWIAQGAEVRPTGRRHPLASTQTHHAMEGRHLVRMAPLAHYESEPDFARHMGHEPAPEETLYPPHPYEGYAWGMSVDLNACVGCNACVTGCQSENNIPVVGRTEVGRGRAMHWIRVDRYFEGPPESPEILHQPVMCQHCENAPCEVVCPVAATAHSSEGLNEMVYNRCVGTRYCANNCPYKVRRFNFFYYQDLREPLQLQRNPDVTVRSRGVMEKCTYCVQRINLARIEAKKQDRKLRDGEIVTACQQACPADAIVFGDVNESESRVSKLKADPRSYGILTELNTKPRTTYMAALRNPNPEIAGTSAAAPEAHHG